MTPFERFKDLLVTKYSVAPEIVTPEATLDSLSLDSLDVIEMLFDVEDAFGIRIPQDAGPALRNMKVQDLLVDIEKLVAEKA